MATVDEKSLDYIIERLGEIVRKKYDEILNIELIKDLIDSLKTTYPALVEDVVPEKLSYGLILDVTKGFLRRGNGMVYFPKVIELMEREVREAKSSSIQEMIDSISKQLERKDNFWIVIGKRH